MNYRATRDAGGALTIHDVPIFLECEKGDAKFDADWIRGAVAKAAQAERDGYLPPLHVRHHGKKEAAAPVRAAGFFRVLRAAPMQFKGEERLAVFADLVVTDPSVREDLLAKRLPYRSVEIFDVGDPGIDSLALLDHEAPFLELPMLMVSEVGGDTQRLVASATFAQPWSRGRSTDRDTVVAFFRRGQAAYLLTQDVNDANDDDAGKDTPEGEKPAAAQDSKVKAIVESIEAGSITVADLDAILAAVKALRDSRASQDKSTPGAPSGAPASAGAPGGDTTSTRETMSKQDEERAAAEAAAKGQAEAEKALAAKAAANATATKDTSEQFAKLAGENAALKARLDDRDATDVRRDDVATALERLAGRPLGADIKTKLEAFHKEFGPKPFKAYVDSMVATFAVLPSDAAAAAAFAASSATAASAPEAAVPYTELGPDAVKKAAQFAREWQDISARGHTTISEERYVQINMEKAGLRLKAKKPA